MPLLHIPFRGQANLRNHRKIAVFDGQRAITGGMNVADEYMGPHVSPGRWRDLSMLISGQGVATLDAIFRADWQFACREVLAAAEETREWLDPHLRGPQRARLGKRSDL